jgi:phosphate-selective porin OprO/OprP
LSGTALAQDPAPPKPQPTPEELLRREVDELAARQKELERRLSATEARETRLASENRLANEARLSLEARLASELKARADATAAAEGSAMRFHFGRGGFVFGTADGKTEVRMRAVLNFDGRAYFGDVQPIPDTFLIRRARPFIEGTLFDLIDFRIMPDFAQGTPQLLDAYVELHPWKWLKLRGGRFMVPVGLEWNQKDTVIMLAERSLATDLVPYRDLGLTLGGEIGLGKLCYSVGILNGAPDGANGPDFDPQTAKDYIARLFVRPFRGTKAGAWTDLGFGMAASYGSAMGTAASSNLASYKSPGQLAFFNYINDATMPTTAVVASGDRWRAAPQAYWYLGPVGLLAEYVYSSQQVQRADQRATIENQAWNLTASFVLTLERNAYEGIAPKHPVDFHHKAFGAFEIVLRYSELRIDAEAFPTYADPNKSARSARELAGGINWHLTESLKVMLSFHRTDFVGGAPMGGDREPENTVLSRLQLAL